jgi:sugar lactone lactonase YvrE
VDVRKVFVSYARVNRADVDRLVEHLGYLGYQTWIDSALQGGQQWWEEILRNIADCDVFLAIVSRDALNSAACQREFEWAEALRKPMLPVAVEPLSIALPPRLSTIQVINYFDATQAERNALTLAGALASLSPAPSLPNPMPAPPPAPLSYLTGLVELVSRQEPLDHEEQRQLLVQLERALRSADPQERRGGLDVLEQLSGRDNLYADVDRRLTWLKANTPVPSSAPIQSAASGIRPPATPPARRSKPSATSSTSPKSRKMKWALVAALAVVAVGCIVGYLVWPASAPVNTQTAQPVSPAGPPGQSASPKASPGQPTSAAERTAQPESPGTQTVLPFTDLLATKDVAVDGSGNVYVTQNGAPVLELQAGATASVELPLAGVGTPQNIVVNTAGDVYVSDYSLNTVWKLAAGSSTPTALVFDGLKCGASETKIFNPEGVAVDSAGNLYVAEAGCQGRVLTLPAGSSTPTVLPFVGLTFSGAGSEGVAVDSGGNVYVTDVGSSRVLKLASGSSRPDVLPFTGLNTPTGVAVDSADNLYVTDGGNKRVLKLDAGSSTPTELPFTFLNTPSGAAVDSSGNVYVTDGNRVLKLTAA